MGRYNESKMNTKGIYPIHELEINPGFLDLLEISIGIFSTPNNGYIINKTGSSVMAWPTSVEN